MGINLELPEETVEAIAERTVAILVERGLLTPSKLWLTIEEAREISGLSEWEIRKRIKDGTVEKHQPNPGRPPLKINRDSLLRSMGSVIPSAHPTRKEA